jgi:hypothetical protein
VQRITEWTVEIAKEQKSAGCRIGIHDATVPKWLERVYPYIYCYSA